MRKVIRVFSLIFAPLVLIGSFFAGCKKNKPVEINTGNIMQDIDVTPTQKPAYEEYSRQVLEEYYAVAQRHLDSDGEVDNENEEVMAAACNAAAKLYAYACYNERTLDKYARFNNQTGGTDLGSAVGSANIIKQDYYLRVNESEDTCGYLFSYTYKWAKEYNGTTLGAFKSAFEAARMSIVVDTDTAYRFEGDTGAFRYGAVNDSLGCDMVETDLKTKGKEWGVKEEKPIVKPDFISPDKIEDDIKACAGVDGVDVTIKGNINILAENIVKYATIDRDEDTGRYLIIMKIDTDVANKDEASLKMLRKTNAPSDDCRWKSGDDPDEDTGLMIIFSIWDNGLFYHYTVIERWTGTIVVFNGTAESSMTVFYSYSDRDCDMTANLEMLEAAKKVMQPDDEE